MKPLNSQTLAGLWAAVPTPWDDAGRLDGAALARNCQRLSAAGVDGIYTTDSDGEFYAIELDEFRAMATAFGAAMHGCGRDVDAAVGVTWCNTQGVIDRVKASLDAGIPNVHIAFPFFMPLAMPDVDRFFDDIATAVPQARWIHYAHPQCGPTLTGSDYQRLQRAFPEQFIGTKLGSTDILSLTEILLHAPLLSHFVVDVTMVIGMLLGARGSYSYWCNTLPRWHRRYMDACLNHQWDDAMQFHRKLSRFELDYVTPIRARGHRHGIISKARASLSGFLEDSGKTRPPYYPIAPDQRTALAAAFRAVWTEELKQEEFTARHGRTEGTEP